MSESALERSVKAWRLTETERNTTTIPLKGGDGGGTFDDMEARVKRLEDDMKEIKSDLKQLLLDSAEMKGRVSSIAVKADVEAVKSELSPKISDLVGQMKGTLGFWQFIFVVGGVLAIILRWPELFRLAGIAIVPH